MPCEAPHEYPLDTGIRAARARGTLSGAQVRPRHLRPRLDRIPTPSRQAFRTTGPHLRSTPALAGRMISVFAEHRCAGFLLHRGPKGVEAFDADCKSLGLFLTEHDA